MTVDELATAFGAEAGRELTSALAKINHCLNQLTDEQVFQLIAFIRTQTGNMKPKPAFVADPDGQVITSEKQTFKIETLTKGVETPWGLAFLPDGRLLPSEALTFSTIISVIGTLYLTFFVNVLTGLLGLIFLSFFGTLALSASMFPENYDWRYRVISNLLSPRDNPNHY